MDKLLNYNKSLFKVLSDKPIYVDFTMGNGLDTLFLCNLSNNCFVYAFDIQQQALDNTKQLLELHKKSNYKLILDSHSNINLYVKEDIDGGIFNLGYLPKGNKSITTNAFNTINALEYSLGRLKVKGIISIMVYIGSYNDIHEQDLLLDYVTKLDKHKFNVVLHKLINHDKAPYLIIIEKK